MDEEKYFCNNCKRNISASNFATHSAYCERNIKVCKLCNEPVSISEEDKHLKEFHIVVTCKQCQIQVEQWVLPKHQASCTMRLVTCLFCDGEFPFAQFSEHYDFCSSRTEKCLRCQKYVMLKDKQKHFEMHSYANKIQHENIVNEVKQNIVNEELSSSSTFEPTIPAEVLPEKYYSPERIVDSKIETHFKSRIPRKTSASISYKPKEVDDAKKSSASSERAMIEEKDYTNMKSRISLGATADVPQNLNQISKHFGTCPICKQSIPWIDMNTHIPNCATVLGKCSRCGEDVPDHALKDHVLKTCKMLFAKGPFVDETVFKREATKRKEAGYVAQKDVEEHSIACRYCKQECSEDRIEEHIRNCLENCSYECSLCTETVLEKDKVKHDSFECKMLLGIDNYSSSNTLSLNNLSGAPDEIFKNSSEYEICHLCNNNILEQNIQDHLQNCPGLQRSNCLYCFEEIYEQEEDVHLTTCKVFGLRASISEPVYQNSKSGAVPKHSNSGKIVKPQTAKCKFCKTEMNADINHIHEQQCIHQPLNCEQCGNSILLKDYERHTCKPKNRGKRVQQSKTEKAAVSSGIGSKLWSLFSKPPENVSDRHENRRSQYSSDTFNPHGYYSPYSYLGTEEIKIPCEFCEKLFPESDIVLHETGCQPSLVSYAKKDSQEDKESKPPFSSEQSNMCSKESLPVEKFFPVERKQDPSSIRRSAKKNLESNVKPGEFLQGIYDSKTSLPSESETTKDPNKFEDNHSSKSPVIQSVWNKRIADVENEDEGEIPDEHEPVADECSVNTDEEMTDMLEFINEGSITVASDAKIYNATEMKESAMHLAFDDDFVPQKYHTEMPENKKILEDAKSTSNLYKEALKALDEVNYNFSEKNLEEPLISFASETNVQCEKRFKIDSDKYIMDVDVIETEGALKQCVENKAEDFLMQYNFQKGDCENTEEDLKKLAKWRCGSGNSSNS